MTAYLSPNLRQVVIERAGGRCEYCLLPQTEAALFDHEVDHIIAEKHGGRTAENNLALACFECNRYKGSDIASLDPVTQALTPLFNPRLQEWSDHFALDGSRIVALTAIGRATIQLLRLNAEARLRRRAGLIDLNRYP